MLEHWLPEGGLITDQVGTCGVPLGIKEQITIEGLGERWWVGIGKGCWSELVTPEGQLVRIGVCRSRHFDRSSSANVFLRWRT